MNVRDAWRAARQWVPFAARTAFYGSISLTAGPLTPDHRASLWAMRSWCRSSAKALGIDVVSDGEENVPTSGAFVYATNHQSLLDILVLGSVLPGDYKWAAKRSLMKIPFLGWHLQLAGHVPVDRGLGSRAAADVIKRFEVVLSQGKPLLVFPEGTRSEDGMLRPFKNGGFHAAVRGKVPVVPVALEGTHLLMKKGAADTGELERRRTVHVRIGKPIMPLTEGKERARVADLRDRSYRAVSELLLSLGGRIWQGDGEASQNDEPGESASPPAP